MTKRLQNEPEQFVDDTLRGIVAAHRELRLLEEDSRAIVRSDSPLRDKVAIVTGGGSGHLPVFLGYVGQGLCSAAAVGNSFSAPAADTVVRASRAVDGGKGILRLYGNYYGDSISFDNAAEELERDGVSVRTVRVNDDVASAPRDRRARRRGVAGLVLAYKVAGAAAQQGASLEDTEHVSRRAVEATRTMGVGLSPCVLPGTSQPTFTIGDDEMELGIGIHGERGRSRVPLQPAAVVAEELLDAVLSELAAATKVAVMVNSLGATTLEELYIVYGSVAALLRARGVDPARVYVGRYATSLEMGGISLTVMALDEELEGLLSLPAHSPFFTETVV